MLFNPHDMAPLHLNRETYEEAFLLYVDDELTAEQKKAVEAFAAQHPDLQEELDALMATKLPAAEEAPLLDKSCLFAQSMKTATIDEELLLYIDNELPAAQKADVTAKIETDNDYRRQHLLLSKTKLDASQKIVFPAKKSLYRNSKSRTGAHWWRVAAAAVVLLWAGSTIDWFGVNNDNGSATTGAVALQTPPATKVTPGKNDMAAADLKESDPAPTTKAVMATAQKENKTFAQASANYTLAAAAAVQEEAAPATAHRVTGVQIAAGYEAPETAQQIFDDAVVTSAPAVRIIDTDAHAATGAPVDDEVATAGARSGSLKGFLRKTTRFIERTTSINPVNADNELLIGVLAINVK